ncbi:MAG: hypothetical protein H7210_08570 [Pyrinomonadaceae bacterium]|nr:hypothetical protein [Phycisphaerales bacterium]
MTILTRWNRRVRSVGAALVLGASTLLASLPSEAQAQMGMMGLGGEMGDMLKPAVNTRMLKQYGDIIGMSAEQKRAAEELMVAYQADHRDSVARLEEVYQAIQEEAQDTGDYSAVYENALPSAMIKFMKKMEKLNKGILEDIKALLDPAQVARFPAFERALRRKSAVKMGMEGMSKMDLSDTVTSLGLDQSAATAVASVLDQYEIELDNELVAHDKMFRETMEEMFTGLEEGKKPQDDPEKMMKMMKDFSDSAKKLTDINEKYARQIQPQLPEAAQKEFEYQIKLAKYPQVYKKAMATRYIDAAMKMPDLDAGQKEGLKTIKEAYERDADASNSKWSGIIDEVRAASTDEMGGFGGGGAWMLRQNPKYTEALEARKALDTKTIDAVKSLLNDEQKKKMPNAMKRPEFDFDQPLGTR